MIGVNMDAKQDENAEQSLDKQVQMTVILLGGKFFFML